MVKIRTNDKPMFFGASPSIFENAEVLRNHMTKSEKKLWDKVKDNQILGLKFRRQHPVSQFIVDFYCHKIKLAIEIDGGIHDKSSIKEYDEGRTVEIEKFGIKIIRFTNEQVDSKISEVIISIIEHCKNRLNKI